MMGKMKQKAFLKKIGFMLEWYAALSFFLQFYLICPFLCFPLKAVRLAEAESLSPLLVMLPNLRGTIWLMYDFPGKFLLSFGSACNSGNQNATYSPSGSYVFA